MGISDAVTSHRARRSSLKQTGTQTQLLSTVLGRSVSLLFCSCCGSKAKQAIDSGKPLQASLLHCPTVIVVPFLRCDWQHPAGRQQSGALEPGRSSLQALYAARLQHRVTCPYTAVAHGEAQFVDSLLSGSSPNRGHKARQDLVVLPAWCPACDIAD